MDVSGASISPETDMKEATKQQQPQQQPPQWPDEVKWVYVLCHPQKEKERFEQLIPHLFMRGIPKERLRVCAPTWSDDLTPELIFKVYDPFLNRGAIPSFSFKAARLSKGEISLVLNFFAAIQSAAKDVSGTDSILVLESDVVLRRDFLPRLGETLKEATAAEPSWGYISLGDGVGTRPPNASSKSLYGPAKVYTPPHQWVFRCTDSMVLRAPFVANILNTLLPFKECLDWELNFQAMLHGAKSLWADPPLVEQGTTHGREDSALQ